MQERESRGALAALASSSRIWTPTGLKPVEGLVSTRTELLFQHGGGAVWAEAEIHDAGEQQVHGVELHRGSTTKLLLATPETAVRVALNPRQPHRQGTDVAVQDLRVGDRLPTAHPRPRAQQLTPSPFGIAAGIVFGDGHLDRNRNSASLCLYAEKRELTPYFDGCARWDGVVNGLPSTVFYGLPKSFKMLPDLEEAPAHLLGWLAGYFAVDGCVTSDGKLRMRSAVHEHLETYRTVATRLGIRTGEITRTDRIGLGQTDPTPMYTLSVSPFYIPPSFILRSHHIPRFRPSTRRASPWTVTGTSAWQEPLNVFCVRPVAATDVQRVVVDGFTQVVCAA